MTRHTFNQKFRLCIPLSRLEPMLPIRRSTDHTQTNSFSLKTKLSKSYLTTTIQESEFFRTSNSCSSARRTRNPVHSQLYRHPFHLHGHAFQVVYRSEEEAGPYDVSKITDGTYPASPMRRDTVLVNPNGNIVLRFRADNPGIWLFHCHIEWHVASGLVATMIESPLSLQKQLADGIPENHLDVCKASRVPTAGNAAGNTVDLFDLAGENKAPGPLPAGFTPRGIVALVFSCVAAFAGVGVVAWYGVAPIKAKSV